MRADRKKLCQVIRNMLSNALKFTPKGGSVTLTCQYIISRISLQTQGTSARALLSTHRVSRVSNVDHILKVSVSDTGAGISKVRTV